MVSRLGERGRIVRRGAVAAVSLACLSAFVVPGPAEASTPAPVRPSGVHAIDITSTSFTVAVKKAAHTSTYHVYYSTSKPNVYVTNIKHAHVVGAHSPDIKVSGLHYTTTPIWYRVKSSNGQRYRWGAMESVTLAPSRPTSVHASSSSDGTYLTWSSGAASGFSIVQATDAALTTGRRTYTTHDPGHQFTPYGLTRGATYYFAVRALNGSTPSALSATVSATVQSSEQSVKVLTYNVLEATDDGQPEGGQTVAPWSERRIGAARLIKESGADVISIQEAASWIGPESDKKRQVDSLVETLGSGYALAHTEVPPTERGYFRTGDYIIYKTAAYKTVGAGGHWAIGSNTRQAAYQELENRTSGARFLFVAPHLTVGKGRGNDDERVREMHDMLNDAESYADSANVPIVYAGDFNSDDNKADPINASATVTRAAHIADAYAAAQSRSNTRYDSANNYERTPPAFNVSIDHVYAPPGVSVRSWALILDLSHGRFVGTMPSDHNPLVSTVDYPY